MQIFINQLVVELGQGRIGAARHLGQGSFLRTGRQPRRGPAGVEFGRETTAQPLALLEFGYKAHANPILGRHLGV